MATLTHPHWERTPPLLRQIIIQIGRHPFARRFYLAGGTALTLQLGHRVSIDLDFFSTTDELWEPSRQEIIGALQEHFDLTIVEDVFGNLLINIEGNFVGFFSYSYALLAPTVTVEGVALAGLLDIGLMKLDAIADRGARKDFYDLMFITQHIPLEEILEQAKVKYPYVRDFGMMALTALVDFESADRDVSIESFPPVTWNEVKAFCTSEAHRIGRQWFEPE